MSPTSYQTAPPRRSTLPVRPRNRPKGAAARKDVMTTEGFTEPGFEHVRDVFAKNLDEGHDVGASFAAYHRGRQVVDLWGGIADPATERPWEKDTMAVVFSTTKGATATCAHRLAQEGRLDLDAPVSEYWPEFAQAGKGTIPVTQLL